jgi:sugar porter (SP) family MFS transporter
MYLSEIAPARIRGRLVGVYQLAMVVGGLSSTIVSYLLSSSGNWRWMLGSQFFPAVGLLVGSMFVPESPRWLVEKGRLAEGRRILSRVGGIEYAASEERQIAKFVATGQEQPAFSELLRRGTRTALLIAVSLAVLQQLSGDNIIFLYAPIIFQKAGFVRAQDALWQTVLMSCWNLVCTLIAFWSVDRAGRRPLLLVGTFGMTIGFALMGAIFFFGVTGWRVLAVVLLCVGAYASGLAPVSWLIMSEIFPTRLRGRAMAVASFAVWSSFFISGQAFPPAVAYLEKRFGNISVAFWVCAVVSCSAFIFALKMVPETKGRSLEEIAASWIKVKPG